MIEPRIRAMAKLCKLLTFTDSALDMGECPIRVCPCGQRGHCRLSFDERDAMWNSEDVIAARDKARKYLEEQSATEDFVRKAGLE